VCTAARRNNARGARASLQSMPKRPAPAAAHAPHWVPKGGYVPKSVRAKEYKQQLRTKYRNLLSKRSTQEFRSEFRAGVFIAGEDGSLHDSAPVEARAPLPRPPLPPPPPRGGGGGSGTRFSGAEAEAARRDAARESARAAAERAAGSRAAALSARSKQRGTFNRKNKRGQPLLSARMPFLLARVEKG